MAILAVSLPGGTYYVKETVAPQGYNLNTTASRVDMLVGGTGSVTIANDPKMSSLTVQKTSSDPRTISNPNYPANAQFQICTDGDCDNVVQTVTTGSDGYTSAVSLPGGTYYVKETVAPQGYLASTTVSDAIILHWSKALHMRYLISHRKVVWRFVRWMLIQIIR